MDVLANLQQIFTLYRKHFLTLFLATLLTIVLSGLSLGLLAGPLCGGLFLLCLKLLQGEPADYKEIFRHFASFVPTIIIVLIAGFVFFLTSIISAIPLLGWLFNLAVSPALFLLTSLAMTFVVAQKLKPVEAIRRSIGVCLTDPKMIWLYSLVIGLLGSLGAFLFYFPIIFTAPITIIGVSLAYQQLSSREAGILIIGQKEKRIGLTVVASLFLIGLIFRFTFGYQPSFLGRTVLNRNRASFSEKVAGKFLSSLAGEKVEIGRDGSSISVGGITVGGQLPKGYPKDVPLYPKAEIESYFGAGKGENSSATFSIKDDREKITTFYERELTANGWAIETSNFGELRIIIGEKEDGRSCSVSITNTDEDKTTFILTLKQEDQ